MLTLLCYSYIRVVLSYLYKKKAEKNKWVKVTFQREVTGNVTGENFLGLGMIAKDGNTHALSAHCMKREALYVCTNVWDFLQCFMCDVLHVLVSEMDRLFIQHSSFIVLFHYLEIYSFILRPYITGLKLSGWLVTGLGPSPTQFWSHQHWLSYLLSPYFRFKNGNKITYIWFGQL